jgi:hypothetical protein
MDQQNNWTIIILPGNPSDRCGIRNRLRQAHGAVGYPLQQEAAPPERTA